MTLQGFYTNKGRALAAKIAGGTTALTVTRVVAGSGHTADIPSATALPDIRQTLTVGAASVNGSTATLPVTLVEAQAGQSYSLTELGVYASDPNEGEILFQVYQLVSAAAITAGGQGVLRFYLRQTIGAQGVSVTCSPAGVVVEEDLQPVWTAIGKRLERLNGYLTLHVAKTGSDATGDGSEQNPYLTIQKALDSLPKYILYEATVQVHEGVYSEEVSIKNFHGNIRLAGATGETVEVKRIEIANCSWVRVEGLRINNPNEGGSSNAIYIINCGYCVLVNISSTNVVGSLQTFGSLRAEAGSVVNVLSCTLTGKNQAVEAVASAIYLTMGNTITMATDGFAALHAGSQYGAGGGMIFKGDGTYTGTEIKHYGGQIWS